MFESDLSGGMGVYVRVGWAQKAVWCGVVWTQSGAVMHGTRSAVVMHIIDIVLCSALCSCGQDLAYRQHQRHQQRWWVRNCLFQVGEVCNLGKWDGSGGEVI